MRITNELGLPEVLREKCSTEEHCKEGEVSCTTLKNSTRQILLQHRHWNDPDMVRDCSENLFALFGQSLHLCLAKESSDTFVEEKFQKQIGKYLLTGRVDCLDLRQEILFDYKVTSTWTWKYGSYSDWDFQGLAYAYLLAETCDIHIKEIRFVMMFRDWSATKSKIEKEYPRQVEIHIVKVTKKALKDIEKKIKSKIKELEENENVADDSLPLCSDEEMWRDPPTFAVMKPGRKSALKLFSDNFAAQLYAAEVKNGAYVQERKAICKKCESYCLGSKWCSQYKAILKEQQDAEKEETKVA